MKRTKAEVEARANDVDRENTGLRILATCMLDSTPHAYRATVNFFEPSSYLERWTLYRPDCACGGVILVEQFDYATQKRVSWRTVLGTELGPFINNEAGYERGDLARKCQAAQWTPEKLAVGA